MEKASLDGGGEGGLVYIFSLWVMFLWLNQLWASVYRCTCHPLVASAY
jgi:hypothetical protein